MEEVAFLPLDVRTLDIEVTQVVTLQGVRNTLISSCQHKAESPTSEVQDSVFQGTGRQREVDRSQVMRILIDRGMCLRRPSQQEVLMLFARALISE